MKLATLLRSGGSPVIKVSERKNVLYFFYIYYPIEIQFYAKQFDLETHRYEDKEESQHTTS